MLAIGIGIFVVIQVIVLAFVLALCRSAAKTDEAFERARMSDHKHWSNSPDHQKSRQPSLLGVWPLQSRSITAKFLPLHINK